MSSQAVNIREAFEARPGYYFMDPDYSQIEFRLSAAMAGERALLLGFKKGADYYKAVYSQMFKKPLDQVVKSERDIGKVLALGQQYDQGPGGLSRKLNCDYDTAKDLMDKYWGGLACTAQAKEEATQRALQNGGVHTWFGRWRALPELYSDVRAIRGKGLRSVWSTRIQGTAADWMKIAMLRCYTALRKQNRDAHLILTVHDEILFEVSEKEPLLEIKEIIGEGMEFKIKNLPVNNLDLYPDGFFCPVNFEYGYNWGTLFELDDSVNKKGETVIGFRTFCQQNNMPVNFEDPRPEVMGKVSFVSEPNKEERVVVEPRKRVEKKETRTASVFTNGLEPVEAVVAWAKQAPPDGWNDQRYEDIQVPVALPDVETETIVVPPTTVLAPTNFVVVETEIKTEMPAITGDLPSPSNGVSAVASQELPPNDDYAYPCIVIKTDEDLNQKRLTFFKKVLEKYSGGYWVYLEYKGKTIRAGDKLKADPSSEMVGYLKKGLGEKTTYEIYDSHGSSARGLINFV